jgi:hypothetical protein
VTRQDIIEVHVYPDPADPEELADTVAIECFVDGVSLGTKPVSLPQDPALASAVFAVGRLRVGTHTASADSLGARGERRVGVPVPFDIKGVPMKTRVEVKVTHVETFG